MQLRSREPTTRWRRRSWPQGLGLYICCLDTITRCERVAYERSPSAKFEKVKKFHFRVYKKNYLNELINYNKS